MVCVYQKRSMLTWVAQFLLVAHETLMAEKHIKEKKIKKRKENQPPLNNNIMSYVMTAIAPGATSCCSLVKMFFNY